jgi:diadenosine tetraphosphate (Ap4A) HIT family hydrolase
MTLPYAEPLRPIEPAELVVPEPPRRGEPGGEPCFPCSAASNANRIWADDTWTLHNPGRTGLPGSVWLASRAHFDSFADMPPEVAATFAAVCGRVERAVLALGDVGRVHLYRWGDGGAHFHVWFVPRPLGRLDMSGHHLMTWEDAMPPATAEQLAEVGRRIAASLRRDLAGDVVR